MQSIHKWFVFTIVLALGLVSFSFSQEDHAAASSCDDVVFNLVGPESVVVGATYNYGISVAVLGSSLDSSDTLQAIVVPQDILQQATISYELLYGSRVLQRSSDLDFSVLYNQLGSYTVRASVWYNRCNYTFSLPVVSYDSIFAYIGPYVDEFGMGIVQNMSQNDLLLRPFVVDEAGTNLISLLRQHRSVFAQSNDIFFSVKNYSLVFDVLRLMQQDPSIDLSSKRFFIVDDTQKSILKKFLARFTRSFDEVSLYVISSQEAMNIFLQLAIGKVSYDEDMLQASLLQFVGSNWSYSLGYLIDYLLFQGFPLDMLLLLLGSLFAILFIVFLKQVVGISSFGVYYPLLFAVSLRVVGLKTSLFLLVVAFLAKILTIVFTRRFTLLATAKLGFQIACYIFLTLVGMVVMSSLGFVGSDFLVFSYPMMLFIYFGILLIASKLWISSLLWSTKQLVSILIFLVVSILAYTIVESTVLHRVILLYPSLVLLVIVLIVLLGRYTGLQLMEFIRFWPLIRHIKNKK